MEHIGGRRKRIAGYIDKNNSNFFDKSIISGGLTPEQLDNICLFRHAGNRDGYLVINNVDVGEIPNTPTDRSELNKNDFSSEMALLQATAMLGDPVGYRQESQGYVINNFFPHQNRASSFSSDGCDTELELHTENAFHPITPDYLLLLCLRQDPQKEAITYVSSIENILPRVSSDEQDELKKYKYNFLSDYSVNDKNSRVDINNWQTMLYGSRVNPLFRFDPSFMVSDSEQSRALMNKIKDIAWQVAKPIKLSAGDLLVIDNRKTAHARSPFRAQFDGADRWVQRTFVVCNDRVIEDGYKNDDGALILPDSPGLSRVSLL